MKWVLVKKLTELTGYTEDAANAKRKKGVWLEGVHWKKVSNRIHYNLMEIYKWIEVEA